MHFGAVLSGALASRFVYRVTAVLAERPSAEFFDESLPRHPVAVRKDLALTLVTALDDLPALWSVEYIIGRWKP